MAKTKITARKSTGPHGVPRHQLAPRNHELGEGSSRTLGDEGSSSNPTNIKNLTMELETLHRAHAKDQEKLAEMQRYITMNTELRNEAWTREDVANERIHELEFYVEDLEMDNAILHENVHLLYAQLHPPHGDGEVTDEEMIIDLGEVENEEEEEDPEELVYFSDEDEVSSGMDTDAIPPTTKPKQAANLYSPCN